MGGLFSVPSPPPPPPAPAPPPDPEEAKRKERLELLTRRRRGRAGTVATSPRGLFALSGGAVRRKTLLGE